MPSNKPFTFLDKFFIAIFFLSGVGLPICAIFTYVGGRSLTIRFSIYAWNIENPIILLLLSIASLLLLLLMIVLMYKHRLFAYIILFFTLLTLTLIALVAFLEIPSDVTFIPMILLCLISVYGLRREWKTRQKRL